MLILNYQLNKIMCCHMKHLTQVQRYQIEAFINVGFTNAAISRETGIGKSVLSREIKRNSLTRRGYDGQIAQQLYEEGKSRSGSIIKKMKGELKRKVEDLIKKDLSPEQVSGRLKLEKAESISTGCIYQMIWREKAKGGDLYKHLRHSRKRYKKRYGSKDKRGQIKNRVSIEDRPKIVENKGRIGDWEGDTVIGKNHKGAIVTLTERKTNFQLMKKVKSKSAKEVSKAIIALMRESKLPVETITFDNGKEFSDHEKIAKLLNTEIYFAHPYSSWERGLNEYQNKLIRQYVPKKTEFKNVSPQKIRKIQNRLNSRPRKGLGYFTPNEVIERELGIKVHAVFRC